MVFKIIKLLLLPTLLFAFCSNIERNHVLQFKCSANKHMLKSTSRVSKISTRANTNTSFKLKLSELEESQISGLLKGDTIFRIHSIGALSFGMLLLLLPDFMQFNNPLLNFSYQQWSIFILAVSYITFKAPELQQEAKLLLSSTFRVMCLGETFLYLIHFFTSIGHPYYSFMAFIVDAVSFAVFGFLTLGYNSYIRNNRFK